MSFRLPAHLETRTTVADLLHGGCLADIAAHRACRHCDRCVEEPASEFFKHSLSNYAKARVVPGGLRWYAKCSYRPVLMDAEAVYKSSPRVADAENWPAIGVGGLLLFVGASRRSPAGACFALSSAPLLDASFIITPRIGLADAPAMYRTFRDKDDARINVDMKAGTSPTAHAHSPAHQ